jgi:RNA polymerase sigma factor (TIGR02999 family)
MNDDVDDESPAPTPDDVTRLLDAAERGDARAARDLLPLVYAQLRRLAGANMAGERRDHTLDATALVHEAYLRLAGGAGVDDRGAAAGAADARPPRHFSGRRHFYAAAAEAMRRILVEHARRRGRLKRGGEAKRLDLAGIADVASLAADPDPEIILALDDAVRRLREHDGSLADIVRLRFYAGLSVGQTADALGVSERTVKREWAVAKAWLHRELSRDP